MAEKKEPFKELQEQVAEKSRDIWLAGLGMFSTIEEEGAKLFNDFVAKGQEMVEKGKKFEKKGVEFSSEKGKEVSGKIDDVVHYIENKLNATMETIGFSSQKEVKDLTDKVDKLTEAVAALTKKVEESARAKSSEASF